MTTEAITFSRHKRLQHTRHITFTKPNPLRRLRYLVEQTDWDEELFAQEEWIDRMCIGAIVIAALYFVVPVLIMLFLR